MLTTMKPRLYTWSTDFTVVPVQPSGIAERPELRDRSVQHSSHASRAHMLAHAVPV